MRIPVKSVHSHASENFVDSETTITYATHKRDPEKAFANIDSRYVNYSLRWWSLPDKATFRKWIDFDLQGTGLKRIGRIFQVDSNMNGTRYCVELGPR